MGKYTPIDDDLRRAADAADAAAFGRIAAPLGKAAAKAKAAEIASAGNEFDQRDPFEEAEFAEAETFSPADKLAREQAAGQLLAGSRVAAYKSRGRGAALNPKGRFEKYAAVPEPESEAEALAAQEDGAPPAKYATQVQEETPRRIITRNDSADIPFDQTVNPYRGCEHGCIYCYARPSHSYMGLSAGLDFESRLFAKPDAARLLRKELAHPGYKPKLIAMGSNTDPYQPIEKQYQLTRGILQTLYEARHPVSITTKSALILRDADILAAMAKDGLAHISISIETLDGALARKMDPRAAQPQKRLAAVAELAKLKIPVSVMMAPIIPALTDHEIEAIAEAAANAGAGHFSYALLRLPFEVAPLFKDWLLREYPHKYRRVMGQLRLMRGGKESDPRPENNPAARAGSEGGVRADWGGERMYGSGVMAALLSRRVAMAAERFGLNKTPLRLTRRLFQVPESWRAEQEACVRAAALRRPAAKLSRPSAAPAKAQLSLF